MSQSFRNAPLLPVAFGVILLGHFLAAAPGASAKVLAKVNDVEITDDDVKLADEYVGQNFSRQADPKAREAALVDFLTSQQLLVQEAQAEKLSETPDFMKRLAYLRDMALMQAMLAQLDKDATGEAAVKQAYEQAAKAYKPEDEYHALRIVTGSEDWAKEALKRIKGGEDFGKVATEVSKDPLTKGGDLGWHVKEDWPPELAEALVKLAPGQVSDPVKSQVGWNLIKLVEKRQRQFPPLEQARGGIARVLAENARGAMLQRLKEAAKIERADQPATDAPKPAGEAQKPAADKPDQKQK
jgi:peptidyl-prolyl cis-trans isomerase C